MEKFIEVTDVNDQKMLINVAHIIAVKPVRDITLKNSEIYLTSCGHCESIRQPVGLKDTYEKIKASMDFVLL